MRVEGGKGLQAGKRREVPYHLLFVRGFSVAEVPTIFFLQSHLGAKLTWSLSQGFGKQNSICTGKGGIIPREGNQDTQEIFILVEGAFRVKRGNVEVGHLGFNTPNPTISLNRGVQFSGLSNGMPLHPNPQIICTLQTQCSQHYDEWRILKNIDYKPPILGITSKYLRILTLLPSQCCEEPPLNFRDVPL